MSFHFGVTCFLIRDWNALPKKELYRSLQVNPTSQRLHDVSSRARPFRSSFQLSRQTLSKPIARIPIHEGDPSGRVPQPQDAVGFGLKAYSRFELCLQLPQPSLLSAPCNFYVGLHIKNLQK